MNSFQALFSKLTETPEPVPERNEIDVPKEHELAPGVSGAEQRQRQLKKVEEGIYSKALTIMDGSMAGFELTSQELGAKGPPERWVRELGEQGALERWNIARSAQLDKRSAPMALSIAQGVHSTVTRARAAEKGKTQPLNAIVVNMTLGELPKFEEREVIDAEGEEQEWGDV